MSYLYPRPKSSDNAELEALASRLQPLRTTSRYRDPGLLGEMPGFKSGAGHVRDEMDLHISLCEKVKTLSITNRNRSKRHRYWTYQVPSGQRRDNLNIKKNCDRNGLKHIQRYLKQDFQRGTTSSHP